MDAPQSDHDPVMCFGGPRDAETAQGCRELRITEHLFSAELLGGESADDLGNDVGPVEGGENVALYVGGPLQGSAVIVGGFLLEDDSVVVAVVLNGRVFRLDSFWVFDHRDDREVDVCAHHEGDEETGPREEVEDQTGGNLTLKTMIRQVRSNSEPYVPNIR